jgi:MYXO-CTERM domain-containing protein
MKKIKMIFGVLFLSAFLGFTTPVVAQTAETGTTQTTDDDDDDDNGGWGLLGLLGLAGLLGLRRKDDTRLRTDDRTRTTTVNR